MARHRLPGGCCPSTSHRSRRRLRHHRRIRESCPTSESWAFVELVEEAHARGIRVIADLVMNHLRPAPWFQASHRPRPGRSAASTCGPTATPATPTPASSSSTQILNWTYDPVRGQYYWRRFFTHQPDLNYGNPGVRAPCSKTSASEARPRHRRLPPGRRPLLPAPTPKRQRQPPRATPTQGASRARVDRLCPDRVLLAETSQWPGDVVGIFGDPAVNGDGSTWPSAFPVCPTSSWPSAANNATPSPEMWPKPPKSPNPASRASSSLLHDELTWRWSPTKNATT